MVQWYLKGFDLFSASKSLSLIYHRRTALHTLYLPKFQNFEIFMKYQIKFFKSIQFCLLPEGSATGLKFFILHVEQISSMKKLIPSTQNSTYLSSKLFACSNIFVRSVWFNNFFYYPDIFTSNFLSGVQSSALVGKMDLESEMALDLIIGTLK
jgi:hypothetical protein